MEDVEREVIDDLVKSGLTYRAISERLRELYPHITRGLSERSVRRYCRADGLDKRELVTDEELDREIAKVRIISLEIYVCLTQV